MYIVKNPNLEKGNLMKFDKFIRFGVLNNIFQDWILKNENS